MTHHAKETNSAALLVKERGEPQPIHKKQDAEPEILITYVDAEGRETTRKLSSSSRVRPERMKDAERDVPTKK